MTCSEYGVMSLPSLMRKLMLKKLNLGDVTRKHQKGFEEEEGSETKSNVSR
jgi:hypothetical protein